MSIEDRAREALLHPLARFIEIGETPQPPRWIVPQVIAEGVAIIAGGHGSGKTTAIAPLALAVAGIHAQGYALAPRHWRHVIYVAEDTSQVERIVAAYVGDQGLDWAHVHERFHLVPAQRMAATEVVEVGDTFAEYTRTVAGTGGNLGDSTPVDLLPLVVFDTLPATIHLDDENSNSEASAAVAAIKQQFAGLPTWLIGHVSKAALSRNDVSSLRGASAWEADAHQVCYLVQDEAGTRWLTLGKRRFEATHTEFLINTHVVDTAVADQFGALVTLRSRYGIVEPCDNRQDRREAAAEEKRQADTTALRTAILDAVEAACEAGTPLGKSAVAGRIRRKGSDTQKMVDLLLAESWLHLVEVPREARVNPAKSSFLHRMTPAQRDALLATGAVPEVKIPPSWRRADSGNEREQAEEKSPEGEDWPIVQSTDLASSQSAHSPKENLVGTSGMGLEAPIPAVPCSPVPGTGGNKREEAGTSEAVEVEI